jgi:hypothetical protein
MKAKGTLGAVPYPTIKGQSTYYQLIGELEAYGIAKGAPNAKAVPSFLEYYLNGDNYDSNTFFNDKTILDVYKYCRQQTNIINWQNERLVLAGSDSKLMSTLVSASSAQVPTLLAQDANIVGRIVNEHNSILSGLK